MNNFETNLQQYAELAVKVGVNVHPGQTLVVNAPISAAHFVRLIVKAAYGTGAKLVKVNWSDEVITRLHYDLAPEESFSIEPKWFAGEMTELVEEGAAILHVIAENPDLLAGVPQERIVTSQKVRGKAMEKYRSYQMADKFSWSIVAVPSPEWAAKVFPDLPTEQQIDKLWDVIFKTVRIGEQDAVAEWKTHLLNLDSRADLLNEKKYKKIHYTAPGTDLTIELPEGHLWVSGGSINELGHVFVANMPTEEVFTAPLKTGVNGTVRSTKPLSYGGNLIDGFSLTFENGRIIDYTAEQGLDSLKSLIEMDEGAHYLGEVALVPHQSPISDTNILFYNTLFDENASNHLAIGNAYAFCLEGGKTMSKEELINHGMNSSLTHVDFMIGSGEMNINGVTSEGSEEPIFLQGNWAF
ncbi:aminopeptidase [Paenibacillus xylanivorans]|uniref:Peptidase M29 n=1 Tax=Paenibacillus xylanivorans TaxID=1705561 RepID=A0A0M9BP24_9BACL|nr:aminopeptidase [Paenibacillus xylanivorans]KOY15416.1 peptidase M29 [Paenibacillus xylanivorans]